MFFLWVATCSLLLSTVVLHHHHLNRICLVEERCPQDGHLNDEHTQHQEREQEGCSVNQMHHFVVNAKIVNSIQKQISLGGYALVALLPGRDTYPVNFSLVITRWQHSASSLPLRGFAAHKLRGPPALS